MFGGVDERFWAIATHAKTITKPKSVMVLVIGKPPTRGRLPLAKLAFRTTFGSKITLLIPREPGWIFLCPENLNPVAVTASEREWDQWIDTGGNRLPNRYGRT
jgi:hypothetical protein